MTAPAASGAPASGRHRFAVLTAVSTLLLLFVGGLVTTTGSGDAVPDWWFVPISYGTLLPRMVGGVFYEHGHRLVATMVGLLTTILAVWTWVAERRRWVRWLGVAAFLAVVLQGTLGGLRVLLVLSPWVLAIVHACMAQVFFCLVVALVVVTSPRWGSPRWGDRTAASDGSRLARLALIATGACFLQLVLGAVLRHTGVGLALHACGALVVFALVGRTAHCARSVWLTVVLLVQVGLGVATWWITSSGFVRTIEAPADALIVVTAHLPVGALLLGSVLAVAIASGAPARPAKVLVAA